MLVQRGSHGVGRELGDGVAVEDLTLDRSTLEDDAQRGVERVDAGLEKRMDRGWHCELAVPGALASHRDHLLHVESVSTRRAGDAGSHLRAQLEVAEQVVHQRLALLGAERLEQERRRIELSAAPVLSGVEQFRPRHAEEEDRCVAGEVGDVLDEVDELGLSPLQVVDDGDLGPVGRTSLEQLSESDPGLSGSRGDDTLGLDAKGYEHLDERPIRDALAVRKATSPKHVGLAAYPLEEVGDEARLSHPGRAEEREQLARTVGDGILERAPHALPLTLAPDERRPEVAGDRCRIASDVEEAERR